MREPYNRHILFITTQSSNALTVVFVAFIFRVNSSGLIVGNIARCLTMGYAFAQRSTIEYYPSLVKEMCYALILPHEQDIDINQFRMILVISAKFVCLY